MKLLLYCCFQFEITFVYSNNWYLLNRFAPTVDESFGTSVALHNDFAVIGAPSVNQIYIYQYNNSLDHWNHTQIFQEPDSTTTTLYGYAVSIFEENIIVGAYSQTPQKAYIITWNNDSNTWYYEDHNLIERNESDWEYWSLFGSSVGIGNTYAIIGAPNLKKSYMYKKGTYTNPIGQEEGKWHHYQTLNSSVNNFGKSVSISGNYTIIGAPDNGENNMGNAFIFQLDKNQTWFQTAMLNFTLGETITTGNGGHQFGYAVSIYSNDDDNCIYDGDYYCYYAIAVACSPRYDSNKGVCVIFDQLQNKTTGVNVWKTQATIYNPTGNDDRFGHSVDIYNKTCVIGTQWSNKVYVFEYQRNKKEWIRIDNDELIVDNTDDHTSVSVFNNIVIVGVPNGTSNNPQYGSSYIYIKESSNTSIASTTSTINTSRIISSISTTSSMVVGSANSLSLKQLESDYPVIVAILIVITILIGIAGLIHSYRYYNETYRTFTVFMCSFYLHDVVSGVSHYMCLL